jgi:hypothetical protein
MKFYGAILIALLMAGFSAVAQQEEKPKEESGTEPLELPNFIIRGIEQLNVRTGIKQFPDKPRALTKSQLDSLNCLEKQQPALMPAPDQPKEIIKKDFRRGYIKGGFGSFVTGKLGGAYSTGTAGYEFYLRGDMEHSGGHVENSRYDKFMIDLASDYIAPEKYWIFGGSRTRSRIKLFNRNFNLYASPQLEQRNITDIDVGVDVEGNYEGFKFDLGGAFESTMLATFDRTGKENSINGYLDVANTWRDFILGGGIHVDLRSISGRFGGEDGAMANFIQIDGHGAYTTGNTTLRVKAGFQLANNSQEVSRGGMLIDGELEYRFNKNITFNTGVGSGLRNSSYREILHNIPYIVDTVALDYEYDIAKVRGFIDYHPTDDFGLTFGIRAGMADRMAVIVPADTGFFDINYKKGYSAELVGEMFVAPSEEDEITAYMEVAYAQTDEGGKSLPYVAPIRGSVNYGRQWAEFFGTDFGVDYTGERYISLVNAEKLSGFINVSASAKFNILKDFTLTADFENLTNSDIFIRDGYKQRGLFVSVNIMWQF